jgi:hypothetical protein
MWCCWISLDPNLALTQRPGNDCEECPGNLHGRRSLQEKEKGKDALGVIGQLRNSGLFFLARLLRHGLKVVHGRLQLPGIADTRYED